MAKLSKYLLVVTMDIDQEQEKQFNEWYDKEHIPALLKVPGVLSAYRYKTEGTPKYSAIYELERPNVPESDEWKKAVEKTSMKKAGLTSKNFSRFIYERIYSKD